LPTPISATLTIFTRSVIEVRIRRYLRESPPGLGLVASAR
jgi:hypothetical protein